MLCFIFCHVWAAKRSIFTITDGGNCSYRPFTIIYYIQFFKLKMKVRQPAKKKSSSVRFLISLVLNSRGYMIMRCDKTKLLSMTTILTYSQLNFETSLHASTQSLCGSFNYRLCACVYACARMITLCCGTDLKYITLHIY